MAVSAEGKGAGSISGSCTLCRHNTWRSNCAFDVVHCGLDSIVSRKLEAVSRQTVKADIGIAART